MQHPVTDQTGWWGGWGTVGRTNATHTADLEPGTNEVVHS